MPVPWKNLQDEPNAEPSLPAKSSSNTVVQWTEDRRFLAPSFGCGAAWRKAALAGGGAVA
jgi:hypothetical protein